ncbi:MAG: hypothetical protein IJZ80_02120 [Clostridia bacterium]|nr:hypothetical protein [Clostridia bacterium]
MTEPNKKKKKPEIEAPYVPEIEVPDPSVPNRAHTELSLGNFAAGQMKHEGGTLGNFDTSEE